MSDTTYPRNSEIPSKTNTKRTIPRYIISYSNFKNQTLKKKILERKNLERSQRKKKTHLTNRGAKIRIKSNLSSETMQ